MAVGEKFPRGKLSKDDEGAILMAITVDLAKSVVRIDFQHEVLWLAFEKDEAISFAELVLTKARELPDA